MSTQSAIVPRDSTILLSSSQSVRKTKRLLRLKTRKFINEYLACGDATKAALAAGYGAKSAYKTGSRLINTKAIRSEIDAAMEHHREACGLSTTMVLERLKLIAEDDETRPADRIRAYELIGKHLNMFTDRKEVDTKIMITVERIGT